MSALPGDPTERTMIERLVRVDHAGEYGAARIYSGQLAVLGHPDKCAERRGRPTALLPVWHVAGYALGAVTAAMGSRAAMACTVAVEEAIDEHYQQQAAALPESEAPLRATIERFRAEELEHRDIGLENEAELAPAYRVLSAVIKAGCKVAIAVSERV